MYAKPLPAKARGGKRRLIGVFDAVLFVVLTIVSISILYPFLYLLKQSFLDSSVSYTLSLSLIPDSFSLASYQRVLTNHWILLGFRNSILRVLIATPSTLLIMVLAAFPLSKQEFPHRGFWTGLIVFTMFFDGGLIPTYLLTKGLGLIDNFAVLILPRLVDTFSLIIVRNYFMSIPPALEESARIDGCGELRTLFRIILPISAPVLATVALWTIVNHWSWWFDSMIYINTPEKQVLQQVLRRIVMEKTTQMMDLAGLADTTSVDPETVKAAAIIVTTLPVVCVYPFMQRYFVHGIMVGSVKG